MTQFQLYKLFKDVYRLSLTPEEIAKKLGITIEEAEEALQADVAAGLVMEKKSYYLTFEGLRVLSKIAGSIDG